MHGRSLCSKQLHVVRYGIPPTKVSLQGGDDPYSHHLGGAIMGCQGNLRLAIACIVIYHYFGAIRPTNAPNFQLVKF